MEQNTWGARCNLLWKSAPSEENDSLKLDFRTGKLFAATTLLQMECCDFFFIFIHLKFIFFSTNLHNFFDSNRIEVRKKNPVRSRE